MKVERGDNTGGGADCWEENDEQSMMKDEMMQQVIDQNENVGEGAYWWESGLL